MPSKTAPKKAAGARGGFTTTTSISFDNDVLAALDACQAQSDHRDRSRYLNARLRRDSEISAKLRDLKARATPSQLRQLS